MKKIKLLPSIIMLALCLAVLGIGVYSATTGSNTISGTLTVNSAGHEVDIAVYEYTGNTSSAGSVRIDHSLATASQMYGKLLGSATSRASSTISGINFAFNSDEANTLADVDMIDLVVAVTNKSSSDIGVYFWDGEGTKPEQVTGAFIDAGHVVYGHQDMYADDDAGNPKTKIVDAEYSFYHHIPGSVSSSTEGSNIGDYNDVSSIRYYTEFMHIYFTLEEAGFTSSSKEITLGLKLNVEKYVPNCTSYDAPGSYATTASFVKVEGGLNLTFHDFVGYNFNTSIKQVVLPYGVDPNSQTFGADGGDGCLSGLLTASIPTGVTSLPWQCFYGCSNLSSVILPSTVTSFEDYCFGNCTSLRTINFPSSVTSIGDWAFSYCSSLTSITIPSSVESIGSRAFYNSGLTAVVFENTTWYTSSSKTGARTQIDLGTYDLSNTRTAATVLRNESPFGIQYWFTSDLA